MSPAEPAGTGIASRPSLWFGLTGVLLLATLVAASFLQVRQYALLNQAASTQDDFLVLSLQQIETEYLRLREQWLVSVDPVSAAPKGDLQLRYEIFVSRIELLRTERAQRLLGMLPGASALLAQLRAFTDFADVHLMPGSRTPFGPAAARGLLPTLQALGEPIHQLLLDANQYQAQQIASRGEALRQYNLIGLAMTVVLSATTLSFALIALRQMRKLEQRRLGLEHLADELRDARAMSESANAAKSAFLADVSHELRTPLHGLMGMLSLLKDVPLEARGREWLRTADDSAVHLLRLLDDLLDLAKLEAGTLSLAPQTVKLQALLNEVEALMRTQALAKSLQLEVSVDDALPAYVQLDPTRVRQVLFNLLNNAIKFSQRGTVRLAARLVPGASRDHLEFEVADSGIGMDAATVERLFRRFATAEDPRARAQRGTGLGLAISRNLAQLMGGSLRVDSEVGQGSVFVLRCPLHVAPAPAEGASPAPAHSTRPLRVLVAEDHPVNRMYLGAVLDRLGHTQRQVEDGAEAVRAMREQPFDVVLMDVHMPRLDGIAATAQIRALPSPASRTLIIALTADVFEDTREQCLRAGADDVITKPVDLDKLTTVLVRYFGAAAETRKDAAASEAPAGDEPALLDRAACARVRGVTAAGQLHALYAGLLEQAAEAGARMRDAMRDADLDALRGHAHAVKGAALNLGLPALAQAATTLNRDATTLPPTQLALAVQRFEEIVAATRSMCRDEGLLSPSVA